MTAELAGCLPLTVKDMFLVARTHNPICSLTVVDYSYDQATAYKTISLRRTIPRPNNSDILLHIQPEKMHDTIIIHNQRRRHQIRRPLVRLTVNWSRYSPGIVGGNGIGVALGVAVGVTLGVVVGVGVGDIDSTAVGVADGLGVAVTVGVAVAVAVGVAVAVAVGVVVGVAVGDIDGTAVGVADGLGVAVTVGVAVGVDVGVVADASSRDTLSTYMSVFAGFELNMMYTIPLPLVALDVTAANVFDL